MVLTLEISVMKGATHLPSGVWQWS